MLPTLKRVKFELPAVLIFHPQWIIFCIQCQNRSKFEIILYLRYGAWCSIMDTRLYDILNYTGIAYQLETIVDGTSEPTLIRTSP